jgi:hypothetical protein
MAVGKIKQFGKYTLLSTGYGLAISSDSLKSTNYIQKGLPSAWCDCFMMNDDGIYAALYKKGVYFSPNLGKTWKYIGFDGEIIRSIVDCQGDAYIGLYGSNNRSGVFKYDLSKDTLIDYTKDLGGAAYNQELVSLGDTLFTGNEFGLYRIRRNQNGWEKITPKNNDGYEDTKMFSKYGNRLFWSSWTGGRTFSSDDNGNSFELFKDKSFSHIVVNGNTYFLGNYITVYKSNNNGVDLVEDSVGLDMNLGENSQIKSLELIGDMLYLSTYNGLYSQKIGASDVENTIPESVGQAYAFYNPNTSIVELKQIEASKSVQSIRIINSIGGRISDNSEYSINRSSITIPFDKYQNGVYIIQVVYNNGETRSIKCIINK